LRNESSIVVYNARIRQRKLPLLRLPEAKTERACWLVVSSKGIANSLVASYGLALFDS
jgi:hypothetical protein